MAVTIFFSVIVVLLVAGVLLFSKSLVLGKALYRCNNFIERKVASLHIVQVKGPEHDFIYLTNDNSRKPYMILLHGFSADKNIWLKFAKHASKDYHLIIPDLLAHGDMPYFPNHSYSAYHQADFVAHLINHLGLRGPLTIVGNSMGGMVAAILANGGYGNEETSRYDLSMLKFSLGEAYIDKAILVDPAGAKSQFALEKQALNANPFSHNTLSSALSFFDIAMKKRPFFPPSVLHYVAQSNYLEKKAQYEHMFADFFFPDVFFDKALNNVSASVLIIWGEDDDLIPVVDSKMWLGLVDSTLEVFSGIGHMPMVECPKQTYETIHSF